MLLAILMGLTTALGFSQEGVRQSRQKNMAKWEIPKANYSGITHIEGNRYAVVSDKERSGGFYLFDIAIDSVKGKVRDIRLVARPVTRATDSLENDEAQADVEDIAYVPQRHTVFIADERQQRIVEHALDGRLTGRELRIPAYLSADAIYPNYGFESLTYSTEGNLLWTVTEHTLREDGSVSDASNKVGCRLRLQSFSAETGEPVAMHYYKTDAPIAKKQGRHYAFGVSAITALEDGTMLLMEREFYVSKNYLGSWVNIKIYKVNLQKKDGDGYLQKELVTGFKNRLNAFSRNIANYEGMCLGPKLADGSQTVILIADSQNNYGNHLFHLKDYIRIIQI